MTPPLSQSRCCSVVWVGAGIAIKWQKASAPSQQCKKKKKKVCLNVKVRHRVLPHFYNQCFDDTAVLIHMLHNCCFFLYLPPHPKLNHCSTLTRTWALQSGGSWCCTGPYLRCARRRWSSTCQSRDMECLPPGWIHHSPPQLHPRSSSGGQCSTLLCPRRLEITVRQALGYLKLIQLVG